MAFISEEIKSEKDKQYFKSIALESMTGKQITPIWWTIDRDQDIVLYERGGDAFSVMGVPFVEHSKILEINVKIIATPILV